MQMKNLRSLFHQKTSPSSARYEARGRHNLSLPAPTEQSTLSQSCTIGVARGNMEEYIVVLCFETRCPKQKTVARLKSKYLHQKKFGVGYVTVVYRV